MTIEVEKKSGKAPHLALTHKELQNGSANGRNVSLLMKSDACVTPEVAELIEKLSGLKVEVSVEKASFETLRNGLKQKLLESFGSRQNESAYWLCVEDFDQSHVVFCVEDGIYYTSYTLDENGYVRSVGETATPVHQVLLYKEEEGGVVLSDSKSIVEENVRGLIIKSFNSKEGDGNLVKVLKSIKEKEKTMEVEIQKAVSEATEVLKAELEKANAVIADLEKSAREEKDKARKGSVSAVVADPDKAEELFKATQVLDDSAFEVVLKSLSEKLEQVEESDLFKRVSDRVVVEKADELPYHAKILMNKYNKQD